MDTRLLAPAAHTRKARLDGFASSAVPFAGVVRVRRKDAAARRKGLRINAIRPGAEIRFESRCRSLNRSGSPSQSPPTRSGDGSYPHQMATGDEVEFPTGTPDEAELLLQWLRYLRGAVVRKASGLDDSAARWKPDGRLISLIGIINHLTHVEWRWIDGCMYGAAVSRSEEEFNPDGELTLEAALTAYRQRATATDATVASMSLTRPSKREPDKDLRWVLLHLINETARHAGHADATRELLDGTTGE